MRFTALLLIVALLLQSTAGFAMAGCHAGHQIAALQIATLSEEQDVIQTGGRPLALDSTTLITLPDRLPAGSSAAAEKSVCNLCASCCLASTTAIDQTPDRLTPDTGPIHSPDFVDLSILLSRKTQPPNPF